MAHDRNRMADGGIREPCTPVFECACAASVPGVEVCVGYGDLANLVVVRGPRGARDDAVGRVQAAFYERWWHTGSVVFRWETM